MRLKVYDFDKKPVGTLTNAKDCKIVSTLSSGQKELTFTYPTRDVIALKEEMYLRTEKDEYVIKECNPDGEWTSIVAENNLEGLDDVSFTSFVSTNATAWATTKLALQNTNWTLKTSYNNNKQRTINLTNVTLLDILNKAKEVYIVEMSFDTINKVVRMEERLGKDKGAYLMDGFNLKDFKRTSNSTDYCTRIIPLGAEDLTIESVNDGKRYVENYTYSNKIKTIIWSDSNYNDAKALKQDAEYKLSELAKPKITYTGDVVDLAKMSSEYKGILDYDIGDTVLLISDKNRTRDKQRIVKMTEYPDEPTKNSVELGSTLLSFEDLLKAREALLQTIENTTNKSGIIVGSKVYLPDGETLSDALGKTNDNVSDLQSGLDTTNSSISDLQSSLDTTNGNVTNLQNGLDTTNGNVSDLQSGLTATNNNVTDLQGKTDTTNKNLSNVTERVTTAEESISETNQRVTNAETGIETNRKAIEADAAKFDELEAKDVEIENLVTTHITASDGKFESLTAEDAKIENIIADHVKANEADVTKLTAKDAEISKLVTDHITASDGKFKSLTAKDAEIDDLVAKKLDANFANIDVANIDTAKVTDFFATAGKIENLTLDAGVVTGELDAVTFKADSITANSLKLLGKDGLYYQLNVNGETVEAKQTTENALNGNHIIANTITASKINVSDLSAFNATIGGFKITENSLYSDVKSSVANTTRGIYMDNDGQVNVGDNNNYLTFYKTSNGEYKLKVKADEIVFGSGEVSLPDAFNKVETMAKNAQASADGASKVATNYLSYSDGQGLIVGNMTDDEIKNYVKIDSDSVDIISNGQTVAAYGEETKLFRGNMSLTLSGNKMTMGSSANKVFEAYISNPDGQFEKDCVKKLSYDNISQLNWSSQGVFSGQHYFYYLGDFLDNYADRYDGYPSVDASSLKLISIKRDNVNIFDVYNQFESFAKFIEFDEIYVSDRYSPIVFSILKDIVIGHTDLEISFSFTEPTTGATKIWTQSFNIVKDAVTTLGNETLTTQFYYKEPDYYCPVSLDPAASINVTSVAYGSTTLNASSYFLSASILYIRLIDIPDIPDIDEEVVVTYDKSNFKTDFKLANQHNVLLPLIDLIYPVGSIYMSMNKNSPATFLGGTWEQIKDRFLLSASDTYEAGTTGGEATHKLTTDELPSHTHYVRLGWNDNASHGMFATWVNSGTNATVDAGTTTNATGGDKSHNNMPPYLVVFMWKRTA